MPDFVTLTNPQTAALYKATTEWDQYVEVPARKGDGTCYRGPISGITPDAAERYLRWGGNLIQRKPPVVAAVDKAPKSSGKK